MEAAKYNYLGVVSTALKRRRGDSQSKALLRVALNLVWGNQVCRVIRTQLYSCILHLAGMLRLGVCQPNNYNYKTGNKHLSSSTI